MKLSEVRQKQDDDLRRDIAAAEKDIWTMRFQRGSEKVADPSRIRHLRKDVARMRTVLRERELGIVRGSVVRGSAAAETR